MLLQRNSDCADRIKVIHLLRDTREKFNSHLHLQTFRFYKYTNGIKKFINLCCSRILQDITLRKKIETNVANNLSKAVEEIYDFIIKGKAPIEVDDLVSVLLHHMKKQAANTAVMKSKSSHTAGALKSQLSVQD